MPLNKSKDSTNLNHINEDRLRNIPRKILKLNKYDRAMNEKEIQKRGPCKYQIPRGDYCDPVPILNPNNLNTAHNRCIGYANNYQNNFTLNFEVLKQYDTYTLDGFKVVQVLNGSFTRSTMINEDYWTTVFL